MMSLHKLLDVREAQRSVETSLLAAPNPFRKKGLGPLEIVERRDMVTVRGTITRPNQWVSLLLVREVTFMRKRWFVLSVDNDPDGIIIIRMGRMAA